MRLPMFDLPELELILDCLDGRWLFGPLTPEQTALVNSARAKIVAYMGSD